MRALLPFGHELDVAAAVLAHDFAAHVLRSGAEFVIAVRTRRVERSDYDGGIVDKRLITVLALDVQALVLIANPEFRLASGANDIATFG
jgi:hypothetical protein